MNPIAEQQAAVMFALWARMNPTLDDPEVLAKVYRAYLNAARRDAA